VYLTIKTPALILYCIAFSVLIYFNSPKKILLKIFLSKAASRLAVLSFNVQNFSPYVANGLVTVL